METRIVQQQVHSGDMNRRTFMVRYCFGPLLAIVGAELAALVACTSPSQGTGSSIPSPLPSGGTRLPSAVVPRVTDTPLPSSLELKEPGSYPSPVESRIIRERSEVNGRIRYSIRTLEQNETLSRNTSLQNALDLVASKEADLTKVDIVLEAGVHRLGGVTLLLDIRHAGLTIIGENGATIDAEERCRAIYIDGEATRDSKHTSITMHNLSIINGFVFGRTGEGAQKAFVTRKDRMDYTLWNIVDGGTIVVHANASVHMSHCTIRNSTGIICGGAISIDTGVSREISTFLDCQFNGCYLIASGLGTGLALDFLGGRGKIERCSFLNCSYREISNAERREFRDIPYDEYDDGIVAGFEGTMVEIEDCKFYMTQRTQVAVAYGGADTFSGEIVLGKGNVVIYKNGTSIPGVDRLIKQIRQRVPTARELQDLACYNFVWDPEKNDYARELTRINNPTNTTPKWADDARRTLGALKNNIIRQIKKPFTGKPSEPAVVKPQIVEKTKTGYTRLSPTTAQSFPGMYVWVTSPQVFTFEAR